MRTEWGSSMGEKIGVKCEEINKEGNREYFIIKAWESSNVIQQSKFAKYST